MLDNKLIESALQLTGNTMEDMYEQICYWEYDTKEFSIEKFCYYLLSPEFIEKCRNANILNCDKNNINARTDDLEVYIMEFGTAIYEYQLGNEQQLITLLEKIWN